MRARPATKPTKQRKMLFQAPAHVRHKLLAAHLSPELRGTHIVKTLPVRTGDTIRIMRGDHRDFEGKISRVDLGDYRIYVEGLSREKVDGTTIFVPVHPSKVMVTHLNLDDKWRKEILEAKKEAFKKPKVARAKPLAGAEEKPPEIAKVEEAVEEKTVAEEKAKPEEKPKVRPTKRKRRIVKRKPAEKPETKVKEAAPKEEKPAPKKRTRRKASKPVEEGEG